MHHFSWDNLAGADTIGAAINYLLFYNKLTPSNCLSTKSSRAKNSAGVSVHDLTFVDVAIANQF